MPTTQRRSGPLSKTCDAPSQTPLYAGATTSTDGTQISVTVSLTGCVGGCAITQPYFVPPGVTAAQDEVVAKAGLDVGYEPPAAYEARVQRELPAMRQLVDRKSVV